MTELVDFYREHLKRRLKNISEDHFDSALLAMGIAAFNVIYRNKRNRGLLLRECHGIFAGITDTEVDNMELKKQLADIIEAMVVNND